MHELIQAIRTTPRPAAAPVDPDIAYSMCSIGAAGRIHDRAVLDALHWQTATRLGIRCAYGGILLAHRTDYGTTHVTQGYFRVPFRQRRQADLNIGDKVLLVAHPQRQQLTIYPPPVIHPFFSRPHAVES
ncbi:hypothetical protein OG563_38010 [Nocardia vinacea]|uniref:Uncharacterized protein n=1 Tax=Nocardia vinacea TaxID=96468 RepID=A0ABZ1YP58_9NOCA|nr:hypothetical protein [Nocardia vinacea]